MPILPYLSLASSAFDRLLPLFDVFSEKNCNKTCPPGRKSVWLLGAKMDVFFRRDELFMDQIMADTSHCLKETSNYVFHLIILRHIVIKNVPTDYYFYAYCTGMLIIQPTIKTEPDKKRWQSTDIGQPLPSQPSQVSRRQIEQGLYANRTINFYQSKALFM